jgi:cytochrome c
MNRCVAAGLLLIVTLFASACSKLSEGSAAQAAGAQRSAPELMIQYGCPSCHVIPHVPGAVGKVGPSLDSLAQRSYLAGSLPNTPDNLQRWIMHPQHYQPGTAMPEMGVPEQDARRIATFIESHQ